MTPGRPPGRASRRHYEKKHTLPLKIQGLERIALMTEYRGMAYLQNKLNIKRIRVQKRYRFYEMKNMTRDFNISTPPGLRDFMSVIGWCAKAVDSLADRLVFREFKNDNFGINEIFRMNNPDILFDSAVLSAMISSCCFIYISKDEDDYPQLQVIDGGNATGVMNPITGLLNEGYAVLDRDENGTPILEAYLKAGSTRILPERSETVGDP